LKVRGIILRALAVLLLSGLGWPQNTNTTGPEHDIHQLRGDSCSSCHAALSAASSAAVAGEHLPRGVPWDRDLFARTFHTYDAQAGGSKEQEKLTASHASKDLQISSILCVSCHDGVSTRTLVGAPAVDPARPPLPAAAGLLKEHPVNVAMPPEPAIDTGYALAANAAREVKLFGPNKTVQCGTCHDVHNSKSAMLLRKSEKSSALCVSCHP
jgi:predicted CXXCH cytochrome family protein